jgi:cysteine desulfurase
MGYPEDEARGAIRVSVGWSTTEDDVDRFLEALPRVVEQVRAGLDVRSAP